MADAYSTVVQQSRMEHQNLRTSSYYALSTQTHRLPRDNQRDRQKQTKLNSTGGNRVLIPVWEQLATDQTETDPWQVVPRQIFTPYDCLLISVAFIVLCRVGCLGVTGVADAVLLIKYFSK